MIENARFTQFGSVVATINGVEWSIPDDPTNSDRALLDQWVMDGKVIEPYLPQEPTLRMPNLEPDQFWFVVRVSGYEPNLLAWVASMNDPASPTYNPVNWAAASAKLEFAKFFERDHEFVEAAREAIGMTAAELDALWQFGAS